MSATAPGFHAPRYVDYDKQPWMLTDCIDCGAPAHHLCRNPAGRGRWAVVPGAHKARRVPESRDLPEGWPVAYTANGVKIVPGLPVLDYNRKETTVTDARPSIDGGTVMRDAEGNALMYADGSLRYSGGTPWFDTANGGMFDGSRLLAL